MRFPSTRAARALGVAFSACAVLVGCGEDGGCPGVRRCDIRQRECQRSVIDAVACMRGGSLDAQPRVSVVSQAEFVERVSAYGEDDPEARAEAEAAYVLWNRGLSRFGLAPEDYDSDDAIADTAAEVAAAYFPEEKDIVIVDRGRSLSNDSAVEVFAHEIVHALQDQELDLGRYQEEWTSSYDAGLALDALIEGEAVHYQILAALQLAGIDYDELDWEKLYSDWRAESLREAELDDAPVQLADARFPYAFGGGFVSQHWLARGRAGIDALFESPPRTTSEVLFGTEADELQAERDALHDRAVPVLGPDYDLVGATSLGAWIARVFAAREGLLVTERLRTSSALGADQFSVHHDPSTDALVAAWRVRMRSGNPVSVWPGGHGVTIERFDATDERETALVAAVGAPAEALEMLAWQAPAPSMDEDDRAAAAASAFRAAHARRFRACRLRRPPL